MTVWEMLRATDVPTPGWPGPGDARPAHRQLAAGAGCALASALLVVLPALLVWVASPESAVAWTEALTMGASLWALGLGAQLSAGPAVLSFTPLLFAGAVLAAAVWSARRAAAEAAVRPGPALWGLLDRRMLAALGRWAAGYAGCAALSGALALLAPAPPVPWTLVLPVLGLPAVAAVVAALRLAAADPRLAGPRWDGSLVPAVLRRALRPAALGAGAMLGLGLLGCAALLWASREQVGELHDQLDAGIVGAAGLVLGQLLAVPNAALWAVSFAAGTGFQVLEGATTTWTGSRSGLMPMVPGLAALPEPGAFPAAMPGVVLAPVAVGALIGWRSLRSVPRLSSLRAKSSVAATAAVLAAGGLGLADALGGGSLGEAGLADVGAPAAAMTVALAVEFAVGTAAVIALDCWRLRR
jgi:hypothetical protein